MNSPNKKILLVIGSLALGGGAERVAATLGEQLRRAGYEPQVLTFYTAAPAHRFSGVHHDFRENRTGNPLAKAWKLLRRAWGIRKILRRENVGLVISFLEEANFCALACKWAFFDATPVVATVHNNVRKKNLLYRSLVRFLYPSAQSVVAVSREIESMLKRDFGLNNTTTIYNAMDLAGIGASASLPLPEDHAWLAARSPLFVSVGRLVRQKGQWHLIRAFQKVAARCPGATLVLLGEGPYRPRLEALIAACGLAESVHLLGNRRNVFPYLRAADAFVLASLWEGAPLALLEALAAGLPVISTDCATGPREILAPELSLEESVDYPFRASFGTLVAPLSGEESFLSPAELPLGAGEAMLAEVLLEHGSETRETMAPHRFPTAFRIEEVMGRWRRLIQGLIGAEAELPPFLDSQAGYSDSSKESGQSPNHW